LEPGETPASHQAPDYVQRSKILQNTLKRFEAVAVRLRLFFQLTYVQYCISFKPASSRWPSSLATSSVSASSSCSFNVTSAPHQPLQVLYSVYTTYSQAFQVHAISFRHLVHVLFMFHTLISMLSTPM